MHISFRQRRLAPVGLSPQVSSSTHLSLAFDPTLNFPKSPALLTVPLQLWLSSSPSSPKTSYNHFVMWHFSFFSIIIVLFFFDAFGYLVTFLDMLPKPPWFASAQRLSIFQAQTEAAAR